MYKEIWKDIVGYEGLYQVSNLGKVRSLDRTYTQKARSGSVLAHTYKGCVLKPNNVGGYLQVNLQKHKKRNDQKIHRLVAQAFIPNLENKREVNHIDGDKTNNNADNLEWVTTSENQLHSHYVLKQNIKPVLQYDLNGTFIREWEAIKIASKELNIFASNISDCCRGKRKTAGRYIWKYKD